LKFSTISDLAERRFIGKPLDQHAGLAVVDSRKWDCQVGGDSDVRGRMLTSPIRFKIRASTAPFET
jgi:hypothetical protein